MGEDTRRALIAFCVPPWRDKLIGPQSLRHRGVRLLATPDLSSSRVSSPRFPTRRRRQQVIQCKTIQMRQELLHRAAEHTGHRGQAHRSSRQGMAARWPAPPLCSTRDPSAIVQPLRHDFGIVPELVAHPQALCNALGRGAGLLGHALVGLFGGGTAKQIQPALEQRSVQAG